MTTVDIPLLPHQAQLLQSNKHLAGIVGDHLSGKSYILSLIIALEVTKGHNVLALSHTHRTLGTQVSYLMIDVCNRLDDLGVDYTKHDGDMTITCNGGTIYFFSDERLDNIRGITDCRLLACDDISLAPNDLFVIVSNCFCEDFTPKIRFCTTPTAMHAMIDWDKYYIYNADDAEIITGCTMADNLFISR